MEVYKLRSAVTHEDNKYEQLEYDLENLTGQDMLTAEQELSAMKIPVTTASELSKPYLAAVFAKSAKVPVDVVLKLKAKDFSAVTMLTQDFLLG